MAKIYQIKTNYIKIKMKKVKQNRTPFSFLLKTRRWERRAIHYPINSGEGMGRGGKGMEGGVWEERDS